ncbi:MAG TPA: HAD-IC family P-type ATPase [Candidatus Babeliales bacterium]|nr:HAD-IC family P-type ATPase [Candidatus Babeliales bacterium]
MKMFPTGFSFFTDKNVEQIVSILETSLSTGLSNEQVAQRRNSYGYNQIASKRMELWQILWRQCQSPFMYLLIIVALISFFLENHLEGIVVVAILLLNILLGFYQEYRAEKTAELLKRYLASRTKVLRNGQEMEVATKELLPGDIVMIYPGDILPADLRFINAQHLVIDESMLTGESVPVDKTSDSLQEAATEIFKACNIGFVGTTVLSGKGIGVVYATGKESSLGRISAIAQETVRSSSLSKIIGRFSTFILYMVVVSLFVIVTFHLVVKDRNQIDIIELIMFATALAISVIPEALPLVMTFALSQGALRLAHQKTVVKRLSAIEDLGNIEILCTDKTGTLTENLLSVGNIFGKEPRMVALYAMLVGKMPHKHHAIGKGFDIALYEYLTPQEHQQIEQYERLGEIPFDPIRLSNLVLVKKDQERLIIIRGAAEVVINKCSDINPEEKEQLNQWILSEGKKGNRALAIAYKKITDAQYDLSQENEQNAHFLGLISFQDPIKKTASKAIEKAKSLGLTLKILSGDSKDVCAAVAYQLGLISDYSMVMTGAEFAPKSEHEKLEIVKNYDVFARVSPENKYEIVKLLGQHHDVGYLGDGINDVLALKEANVGLAVDDAVDIAREAADIILLKKSLMVIVDGIEEGRRVFANTLKYLRITLSASFGNFYSIGIASLIVDFLPLLPIQILTVNLLSDFPMIGIATDSVELDELKRPEKYDIKSMLLLTMVLGLVCTIFDFIYFGTFFHMPANVIQTGWFVESILTELFFIFSIRTMKPFYKGGWPSLYLFIMTIIIGIITVILPFSSLGDHLFSLVPLQLSFVLRILAIVLGYFCMSEIIKLVYYRICMKNNGKKQAVL